MTNALALRKDVPTELTWDITRLYAHEEAYRADLVKVSGMARELIAQISSPIETVDQVAQILKALNACLIINDRIATYAGIQPAVDMTDANSQKRYHNFKLTAASIQSQLAEVEHCLKNIDSTVLESVKVSYPEFRGYINNLISMKPHTLPLEVEKALSSLSPVLNFPYECYEQCKLADMKFDSFSVDGKTYSLSFSEYENTYQHDTRTTFRRHAFKAFSKRLRESQHTIASAYLAQVNKEKTLANLRGYGSVFDYLLHDQKVSVALYDTHIDTIMTHLAPAMRRYANLLRDVHGLEQLTFADLTIPLDANDEINIDLKQAQLYSIEALSLLGEDYTEMVKQSFDGRWYDFAQNQNKSTGGFCASPYDKGSYILMSWTHGLGDLYTLVHEIGHAGHFHFASEQNYLNFNPSLYFIEAPSTCNELLLNHYLLKKNDEPVKQRQVLASLLGKTYYHNFVTHYLEAHFQREVYRAIDRGDSLTTSDLHAIKKSTLETFWGEAVVIDDDAALTWMRQPHYYLGLYSYTYSAGLNIATQVYKKVLNKEDIVDDWLNVLRAGGSKSPVELAAMVGVDIENPNTLIDTIGYIDTLVSKLTDLTDKIQNN